MQFMWQAITLITSSSLSTISPHWCYCEEWECSRPRTGAYIHTTAWLEERRWGHPWPAATSTLQRRRGWWGIQRWQKELYGRAEKGSPKVHSFGITHRDIINPFYLVLVGFHYWPTCSFCILAGYRDVKIFMRFWACRRMPVMRIWKRPTASLHYAFTQTRTVLLEPLMLLKVWVCIQQSYLLKCRAWNAQEFHFTMDKKPVILSRCCCFKKKKLG